MHTAAGDELTGADSALPPGVTRFDVPCRGHGTSDTLQSLIRGWADDRALSAGASGRLVALARAALAHGLRFEPREVALLVRWCDLERVRLDLRWIDCRDTARPDPEGDDVDATISTLDTLAADWGVTCVEGTWVHWIVADIG